MPRQDRPLLIVCNDPVWARFSADSELPDFLWLDLASDISGFQKAEGVRFVRICPEIFLSWDRNDVEATRQRMTFLGHFIDSLIVHIVVCQSPPAESSTILQSFSLQDKAFQGALEETAGNRSELIRQSLIFVAENRELEVGDARDGNAMADENHPLAGCRSIYLMSQSLEPPDDHSPIFSAHVWPLAVGTLLFETSCLLNDARERNGVFAWRSFLYLPELSPRSRDDFLEKWMKVFKQRLQQPSGSWMGLSAFSAVTSSDWFKFKQQKPFRLLQHGDPWHLVDGNEAQKAVESAADQIRNADGFGEQLARDRHKQHAKLQVEVQKLWSSVQAAFDLVFSKLGSSKLSDNNDRTMNFESKWDEFKIAQVSYVANQNTFRNLLEDFRTMQRGFVDFPARALVSLVVSLAIGTFLVVAISTIFGSLMWAMVAALVASLASLISSAWAWRQENYRGMNCCSQIDNLVKAERDRLLEAKKLLLQMVQQSGESSGEIDIVAAQQRIDWLLSRIARLTERCFGQTLDVPTKAMQQDRKQFASLDAYHANSIIEQPITLDEHEPQTGLTNLVEAFAVKWKSEWQTYCELHDTEKAGFFPGASFYRRMDRFLMHFRISLIAEYSNLAITRNNHEAVANWCRATLERLNLRSFFGLFSCKIKREEVDVDSVESCQIIVQHGLREDVFNEAFQNKSRVAGTVEVVEALRDLPFVGVTCQRFPVRWHELDKIAAVDIAESDSDWKKGV